LCRYYSCGVSRGRVSLPADRQRVTIVQTAGKIKLILQCAWWSTLERCLASAFASYGATKCEADSVGTKERCLVCQARDKGRNREVNPLLCALYAAHLPLFTYDRARSAEATSDSSLLCSPRPRKRGTLHGSRRFGLAREARSPILTHPGNIVPWGREATKSETNAANRCVNEFYTVMNGYVAPCPSQG